MRARQRDMTQGLLIEGFDYKLFSFFISEMQRQAELAGNLSDEPVAWSEAACD